MIYQTLKLIKNKNEDIKMNTWIKKILISRAGYGIMLSRIAIGIIFVAHGSQKLFGAFGGDGLSETAMFLESLGISSSFFMAILVGSTEFFGGLALIIGLLVRPAALALVIAMLVAIFSVHINNGLFLSNNGYEYALALLAVSLMILIEGAGRWSFDRYITQEYLK
ncbi:quinol oxidase [Gammaproteobacteria bacterium]|nr:quinol oxidase [Gammaproteobacteria bacterium]